MPTSRFRLDAAIAAWRRSYEHRRALSADDLDELEAHLRDQVNALIDEGQAPQAAFEAALREMGTPFEAEAEYGKVFWQKTARTGRLGDELAWRLTMLRSYVQVAARSLLRHKGLSFVNVAGLSLGVACCLLALLFARHEHAVNTIFPEVDQLYRVDSVWREATMGLPLTTMAPVGETLAREYPEVTDQVRLYLMAGTVRLGAESWRKSVMMADTTLFEVFDLPLLHGDPATALREPRSVVVTADVAAELFGTTEVLGQTVLLETWTAGWQSYTITGVREKLPYNSLTYVGTDDGYGLIIPPHPFGDFIQESGWTSWESRYIMQFVKLSPEASLDALQPKLADFVEAYAPETLHGQVQIQLNPLRTLHLTEEQARVHRIVRLLLVVGGLVLLLAGINFTNLSTARSLTRLKEIGVRKVIGARRDQVLGQFLSDSMLHSLLATVVGVLLAAPLVTPFFELLGRDLDAGPLWDGTTLLALLGLWAGIGLAAGAYPALVLSAFRPAKALKGTLRAGPAAAWLRRTLVVVQFAVAVALMLSVYVISQQLSFIDEHDVGFATDQVLVIESVPRIFDTGGVARVQAAKAQLEAVPGVQAASLSWEVAGSGSRSVGNTRALLPQGQPRAAALSTSYFVVDEDFAATYGLSLRAGRFFSSEHPADLQGIVLNERAAQAFGWSPEEALGQLVEVWTTARPEGAPWVGRPVIGVMADHHYQSLYEPIRPLAYFSVNAETMYRVLSLRLDTADLATTVAAAEATWRTVFPEATFTYTFVDEQLDRAYRTEQRLRQLMGMATLLAVVIAVLGMLGLTALSTARRTKEVGVRKVLGASVPGLVALLAREHLRLVLIALAVGLPAAYLVALQWLNAFAYRADVSWLALGGIGLATLLIAGLTVSYHTIKAATANPVQTLRTE
ncbi:MAG: ABC transporter permease [Bacteroidota bacterium]